MFPTQNLHVKETVRLTPPRDLKAGLPMTEVSNRTVVAGRKAISSILEQKDPRLLLVVGPCSIHDPQGALEYAQVYAGRRKQFGAPISSYQMIQKLLADMATRTEAARQLVHTAARALDRRVLGRIDHPGVWRGDLTHRANVFG